MAQELLDFFPVNFSNVETNADLASLNYVGRHGEAGGVRGDGASIVSGEDGPLVYTDSIRRCDMRPPRPCAMVMRPE